jgi:hypothetical protein
LALDKASTQPLKVDKKTLTLANFGQKANFLNFPPRAGQKAEATV